MAVYSGLSPRNSMLTAPWISLTGPDFSPSLPAAMIKPSTSTIPNIIQKVTLETDLYRFLIILEVCDLTIWGNDLNLYTKAINNIGETGIFIHCWWECKWCSLFGRVWHVLKSLNSFFMTSNSSPRYILKRTQDICPHKYLNINIHSSIHYSQSPKSRSPNVLFIHLSINECMKYDLSTQWDIILQ